MMKLIGAFAICALVGITNAIFAGRSFENRAAPFYARIDVASSGIAFLPSAGGSIISNQHILCAAFTIQQGNVIIGVHVGGNSRQTQRVFQVQRTLQHPDYVHATRINNIGLIFLSEQLRFDALVRPIALPSVEYDNYPFENVEGQILGFGGNATNNQQQGSNILEGAFLRITPDTRCVLFYQNIPTNTAFCGEDSIHRSDFCQQDIGGGFTVLTRGIETLAGIASNARCSTNVIIPSLPSLFTRIVPYMEWIRSETGI